MAFVHAPMDAQLQEKCSTMLREEIMKKKMASIFVEPVDWRGMGLLDYLTYVKQPMDLGTVQQRLADSNYQRLEDFANDVRLVWKNAFIFNGPKTEPYKHAQKLCDTFEKELEKLERFASRPLIDTMDACFLVIADMRRNPLAELFLDPIDPVALGIPDYEQVIAEPMDLTTVQRRLSRKLYGSPDEFARDVRLVWQNAITYNSVGMYIGHLAAVLGQIFDRRFAQVVRLGAPNAPAQLPRRDGVPDLALRKKLFAHCQPITLEQVDALVRAAERTCLPAVQKLGPREVQLDLDALDLPTFERLMALLRDPEALAAEASTQASRQVVRVKIVDRTCRHVWDTTALREKHYEDALAEHAKFVAKPLPGGQHEARHGDPRWPFLRGGVTAREDSPAQFVRAWGTRVDKAADPLGLAGSLVTALVQYTRHGAKRERAHALLLCVGFDAGRGQYCLWEPEPEPPPAEATADCEAAASARVPSYYYVAKTELARFPRLHVRYRGQPILARWRDSSRFYAAEVVGPAEDPHGHTHIQVRYRDRDAGCAEGATWWMRRHYGEGRPDRDAVYTIPLQDQTLPPEEPEPNYADDAEIKQLKKQARERLKREAQEREARLGAATAAAKGAYKKPDPSQIYVPPRDAAAARVAPAAAAAEGGQARQTPAAPRTSGPSAAAPEPQQPEKRGGGRERNALEDKQSGDVPPDNVATSMLPQLLEPDPTPKLNPHPTPTPTQ